MTGSVQTVYRDVPSYGLPGQLTDANPKTTFTGPAELDIPVGRAVVKGTNFTAADSAYSATGYKVKLPTLAADITEKLLLGFSVRLLSLPGSPVNTKDSVPYYPEFSAVTYLRRGSMWVMAYEAVADADVRNSVWIVWDATLAGLPIGTILSHAAGGGGTVEYTSAYFDQAAPIDQIVKVVIR